MGVRNEPADVRFLKQVLQALDVGTFGQPDAAGFASKPILIIVTSHQDLRARGRWVHLGQRQKGVCRGAGNNLNLAEVLKFLEGADEISIVTEIGLSYLTKVLQVQLRQRIQGSVPVGAVDFF